MMNYAELASIPSDHPVPFTDQLRLAVAAYLALLTELGLEFQQFSG
jgi:hypothetical protein